MKFEIIWFSTLRLTYKGFPKIVQPSKTLIFGQIFSLSTLTKTLIGFCFSPETLMSQYHQHNPINTYCQSMQCVGLSFHKLKIPLETSQYIKDLSNRWVTFDGPTVICCADTF